MKHPESQTKTYLFFDNVYTGWAVNNAPKHIKQF